MKHYDEFISAMIRKLSDEDEFWLSPDGSEMIVPCRNGILVAIEPEEGKTFLQMHELEQEYFARQAREMASVEQARILAEAEPV